MLTRREAAARADSWRIEVLRRHVPATGRSPGGDLQSGSQLRARPDVGLLTDARRQAIVAALWGIRKAA